MSESVTATAPKLRHGIAEEVRVLLARKRMSATKLAQELGWTQQYISRRMVGDQPFDADDLEAIADVLAVGIVDLLPRSRRNVTIGFHAPSVTPSVPEIPRQRTAPGYAAPMPNDPAIAGAVTMPGFSRKTAPTKR